MPQLSTGPFAALASRIEWFLGSPTTELAAGGIKEPDASMGIRGRKRPTVVIEVGYTESLQRLRMDARRWLTTEVEGKRKMEVNGPVMLVVLISYEGLLPDTTTTTNKFPSKTPAEDTSKIPRDQPANENPKPADNNHKPHLKASEAAAADAAPDLDTSITNNTEAETTIKPPFSIFVELWRNPPVTSSSSPSHTTQAVSTVTHEPVQCERHRFYPSLDPADPVEGITLYATDLFAEWVYDPGRKRSWKLPLALLKDAYEAMWETWNGAGEVEGEMQVVVVGDEDSGGREMRGRRMR